MQYYIEHIYGARLPTHELVQGSSYTADGHQYELLTQLYVLGERLLDAKYQNVILRQFFRLGKLGNTGPGVGCVNVIHRGTTKDSPVRRMMVDHVARSANDYWLKDVDDDTNMEFRRDLSKVLIRAVKSVSSPKLPEAEDYLVGKDSWVSSVVRMISCPNRPRNYR